MMNFLSAIAVAGVTLLLRCVGAADTASAGNHYAAANIRALHDCIGGRSNVSYVLHDWGEVTVFSIPYDETLHLHPDDPESLDHDPNVMDCFEQLGLSWGYSSQLICYLDVLPPGNLPPDSDYLPFTRPSGSPWNPNWREATWPISDTH